MREPEWGDPINAYTKWVIAALVTLCVLFVGVGFASAHQSVVSSPGVVTWNHNDHAGDAIGVSACVQNRHGLVKCLTHENSQYQFVAPYPQVAPNPLFAGTTRLFQVDLGWWWEVAKVGNDGGPGVCVFDNRPYRPPVPGQSRFFEVACLGSNDTTFKNVNDGSVDGTTVLTDPPADFIREGVAAAAALPPLPVARAALAAPRGFSPRVGTGISAHAIYLKKSRGFMLAGLRVDTGGRQRQVQVCLGTSAQGKLNCKSALTRGWNVGLAVPCAPKLPFRLWLLRVNGFPVASTYSRC